MNRKRQDRLRVDNFWSLPARTNMRKTFERVLYNHRAEDLNGGLDSRLSIIAPRASQLPKKPMQVIDDS